MVYVLVVGLVFGGLAVGAIVTVVVLRPDRMREPPERREYRLRVAARNGWNVSFGGRFDWTARLPGADSDGVSLAVSGLAGRRPVLVAEYSFTTMVSTPYGTATGTFEYVVFVVGVSPGLRHVSLAVDRRDAVSALGRRLFGDAVTATGQEEFDRRFKLVSSDPTVARRLIGPALIAEHLECHPPSWSLHNGTLLTYLPGRIQDPTAVATLTGPLARIADLLGH
jgi:hypothetical protein